MVGLLPILQRWRFGIGLFAALAFVGLGLAARHYRHAYRAEVSQRLADRERYADAQAVAAANQAQANHTPAILSKVIAEKSHAEAPAYYDRVRAASERVRKDGPSCPVAADLPGADHPAEVVHGPDPATRVVPAAEFDQLSNAAARASQMRADAQAMIAAGIAVSDEEN